MKAVESGVPVDVPAETTPTQLVTAHPDGTFTAEVSPEPVRVKQGADWIPVNTDLQTGPAGMIVPKAAAAAISFSGGGSTDPLATIEDHDTSYVTHGHWINCYQGYEW